MWVHPPNDMYLLRQAAHTVRAWGEEWVGVERRYPFLVNLVWLPDRATVFVFCAMALARGRSQVVAKRIGSWFPISFQMMCRNPY